MLYKPSEYYYFNKPKNINKKKTKKNTKLKMDIWMFWYTVIGIIIPNMKSIG